MRRRQLPHRMRITVSWWSNSTSSTKRWCGSASEPRQGRVGSRPWGAPDGLVAGVGGGRDLELAVLDGGQGCPWIGRCRWRRGTGRRARSLGPRGRWAGSGRLASGCRRGRSAYLLQWTGSSNSFQSQMRGSAVDVVMASWPPSEVLDAEVLDAEVLDAGSPGCGSSRYGAQRAFTAPGRCLWSQVRPEGPRGRLRRPVGERCHILGAAGPRVGRQAAIAASRRGPVVSSTTTTRLRWWLHPAFTVGGAASLVGAARPLVA